MRLHDIQEEVLACLGRVGIVARQAVESMLVGQHRSIHRGFSVDFVGHRAYEPGDDIRHLDWQVYGRTDRYAVRVYQEETRLRATLVLDASASMAYGGEAPGGKLRFARDLAAALAVLMSWQGDPLSLVVGDHHLREQLPQGNSSGHLTRLVRLLEETRAIGSTNLQTVLAQVAGRIKRRGLVIVLSDGGEDPRELVHGVRLLRRRRQDVLLYIIHHVDEATLAVSGVAQFQDLETGAVMSIDADRGRTRYLAERRRMMWELAEGVRDCGARLEWVQTDEDLRQVLARSLGGMRQAVDRR